MQPQTSKTSDVAEEKGSYDHLDTIPTVQAGHEAPASLRHLTVEEYERLGKKTLLKLDLTIMPMITIMYILNYLDRQNLAAAKLAGIVTTLKLTTTQYQTCVSILFASYIFFQVPSNMIASKVKLVAVYINVMMGLWGVISACTAAVQSFGGLVGLRICLGVMEAAFFPGAVFYLSLFYSKKNLASRIAWLYSGSQVGNAFGGLLAIAILKLDGKHGIEGWRWLYIIEGVVTVGCAILFALIMPSSPRTTRLLSQEQKDYVQFEMQKEQGQADSFDCSAWEGFKQAVVDPKLWLLTGVLHFNYTAAAQVNFFPSLVGSLGYSRNITYCLTAPPYILCIIVMIINGYYSDKYQNRFIPVLWPLFFIIVANVITISTTRIGARYFAMMLMPSSCYASSIVLLSWITAILSAPAMKRAVSLAFINSICNTPNIWTSYVYKGPRYTEAFGMNLAAGIVTIGFTFALWIYLKRQNAKLDKGLKVKSGPTEEQLASGYRYPL